MKSEHSTKVIVFTGLLMALLLFFIIAWAWTMVHYGTTAGMIVAAIEAGIFVGSLFTLAAIMSN